MTMKCCSGIRSLTNVNRLAIFVGMALLTVSRVPLGAESSAFNGRWVLDKNQSQGSDLPLGLEQRVKQSGPEITIESKFNEPPTGVVPLVYLGIMTTTLKLDANGQEVQNQIGPFQQASKTTVNGNQMETEWRAMVKGDEVTGHWVRTIADDGKSMEMAIQEKSTQGQHGEATLRFVKK